jgi:subtilase family serine protease
MQAQSDLQMSRARFALACTCAALVCAALASSASAAARPCADLRITSIVVKPTETSQSQLIAGQPAEIKARIRNAGTCAAGTFVAAFKVSALSGTAASESVSGLGRGEAKTVEMAYDFPTAGEFTTELEVNAAHEVSETNYENDTATRVVTVVPASVTMAVQKFTITPSPPDPTNAIVQGRTAIATITVRNTGNVAASALTVQWTPLAMAVPLSTTVPAGLAPGETATVQLEFVYTLAETVSSTAAVLEAGHLAPVASAKLEAAVEPALPNIRISGVATQAGIAGDPSTIEVTVENNGNAAAGPFTVEWLPGAGQPLEAQQVEGLAEGASTTLTFVNVFTTAGTYTGHVIADSGHQLEELSTTEKQATTVLEVPAATVDLKVSAVSIDPTQPTAGSPATITETVENLGNTASGPFIAAWTPSSSAESGLQTLAEETASLEPGESREVTFSFTYPSGGIFRSVADVNPRLVLKESNYLNNTRALFVVVHPGV